MVYGALGSNIAWQYRIIYDERIPWDAYFSFDNRAIVNTGGGFERHPLANYFFHCIREAALYISDGKKDANFRLVLAACSSLTVSLALIQIFKCLKNILKLPLIYSLLLVVFTGLFSTTILLSFTPETYTYTFFLLTAYYYYTAILFQRGKAIPASALTVASVSVGGLTITNIVKVYIPLLFEKRIFNDKVRFFKLCGKALLSAAVFILLYLNRVSFNYQRIFEKTGTQYEKFSKPKLTPLWDMVLSWFFGGNMLFPSFIVRDYHSKTGFQYKALFMDTYSSWLPYLFTAGIIALVLWSYIANFRNKLVQILMLSLAVDIFIHCILRFGLHTAYIYGGHYIFVVPLIIGFLFQKYRYRQAISSLVFSFMLVLSAVLLMNNMYRMQDFFMFLHRYYQ